MSAEIIAFPGAIKGRSATYALFRKAMIERKQVLCTYGGYHREVCPIIIGTTDGKEKALTYQFGGQSRSGLPAGGEWRCLTLADVADVQLRDGDWLDGDGQQTSQRCVVNVDLDVNLDVRPRKR